MVVDSCSFMLCRLLSLCGMQLYASGPPCQETISVLCGDMFCTMSSGMTACCTLACPNPCHAVQISWAAQTLLMLLVNTTSALASAADLSSMLLCHICAPICPFLFAPSTFMLLTGTFLGSPVYYLASHQIDATRCSLFYSFLAGTPASNLTWCRSSLQAQWLSC